MPPNTVSVCRPGKFGNPFKVTEDRSHAQAVSAFRIWLAVEGCTADMPERKQRILESLHELRGKNLACYCKEGSPCHADVLLELANGQASSHYKEEAGKRGSQKHYLAMVQEWDFPAAEKIWSGRQAHRVVC
jgi:hypothetical protein